MDLLNDFDFLSTRLPVEIQQRRWLDAFLLAVGTQQIIDDFVRRGGATMRMGARYLQASDWLAAQMLGAAGHSAASMVDQARACTPSAYRLTCHQWALQRLVEALAPLALDPGADLVPGAARVIDHTASLAQPLERHPAALRRQILRLPACFRSFDQHPQDVAALAAGFAERWPDRTRRLLVVGVRTSGSYLAPLCAAALRAGGYRDVDTLAVRPGEPLLGDETRRLRAAIRAGGMALVLDDPPVTGRSVAQVAQRLQRAGFAGSSIVVLLARCETTPEPLAPVRGWPQLTLPGPEWRIVRALRADSVATAVRNVLPAVVDLFRLTPNPRGGECAHLVRGHHRAYYTAALYDHADGHVVTRAVVAEGTGLGYFGRHALAVGHALRGWVPEVYGFADGVLLRADPAPPDGSGPDRVVAGRPEPEPERVADYVLARRRALPCASDRSVQMAGQCPTWELAAGYLSAALGRLGLPLRIPLLDPLLRRLLTVADPMIIDGRMYPEHWHRVHRDASAGRGGALVKENCAEGAFSNRENFCYDPVFDLAGASAHARCPQFTARLKRHYQARCGQPIPEERWLIYHLVHLADAAERGRLPLAVARRNAAAAAQRYFASTYLADATTRLDGPYCALDIDGVLEISLLGFAMTTAAGALALRALLTHGYQPLLATGRNLDDVRDRCASYGLAGGVAEYGAAVYQHGTGVVRELVTGPERADMVALRTALARIPGVQVDPGHRLTARAYCGPDEARRGLDPTTAEAALAEAGVADRVRLVPGEGQTDFVPLRIDKAVGLRALMEQLDVPDGRRPLVLAVGDGPADATLLEMAEMGFAPGNAHPELRRRGVTTTRAHCQAGLAQAVEALVGHAAGSCRTCRPPTLSPDAVRLLTVLSVLEAGRPGAPARLARLARQAAAARWRS
ncbi:HAD hydrolase family protein [Pseudonocardia adelaidensis]|uniref:HAD hydrolase family protein n=1 Tax=Pseudonocardia adelaidensis TaxID=648754 RepID=UPI0031F14393